MLPKPASSVTSHIAASASVANITADSVASTSESLHRVVPSVMNNGVAARAAPRSGYVISYDTTAAAKLMGLFKLYKDHTRVGPLCN